MPTRLCTCFQCGPNGVIVPARTYGRHLQRQGQMLLQAQERTTEAQSCASESDSDKDLDPSFRGCSSSFNNSTSSCISSSSNSILPLPNIPEPRAYSVVDRRDISIPPPPSITAASASSIRAGTEKLFNIIHAHKAPKVIASSFLEYINNDLLPHLPPNIRNTVPASLDQMHEEIEHALPGFIKIHACPGHILYRGVYASSLRCPTCKKPRFEEDTDEYNSRLEQSINDITAAAAAAGSAPPPPRPELSLEEKMKTYTPRFILYYMPIIPRLKALIAHPVFSHLFRYADTHMNSGDDEHVRHTGITSATHHD
jgi:hypothetical protein